MLLFLVLMAYLVGTSLSDSNSFSAYNRVPKCPGKVKPKTDDNGNVFVCLPGSQICPEDTVCWFNGFDYLCCPMNGRSVDSRPVAASPFDFVAQASERQDRPRSNPVVNKPAYVNPALRAKQALFRKQKQARFKTENYGRNIGFTPRRNTIARRVESPVHSAETESVRPRAVTRVASAGRVKQVAIGRQQVRVRPAVTTAAPTTEALTTPVLVTVHGTTEMKTSVGDQEIVWKLPTSFVGINAPLGSHRRGPIPEVEVEPAAAKAPKESSVQSETVVSPVPEIPAVPKQDEQRSFRTTFVNHEDPNKSVEIAEIEILPEESLEAAGISTANVGENIPLRERLHRERYMRHHLRNGYPYNEMYYYPRDQLPDHLNPYIIRDPQYLQDAPEDAEFYPTVQQLQRQPARNAQRADTRYNYNYARWMTRYGTRYY